MSCRSAASTQAFCPIGRWSGSYFSITQRGDQELSVVCESRCVSDAGVVAESGWRALGVQGPLDFGLTGVLAKLSAVIAEVEISIFAISTHDTDLVLVKADKLENAVSALKAAGYTVV